MNAENLCREEPLGAKTSLGVGGKAAYYAQPQGLAQLRALYRWIHAEGVPSFILGRGTNLLVSDAGFQGCVIRLSGPFWEQLEWTPQGQVVAYAGVRLKHLCGQAQKAGVGGFEFWEGIPGCVGGALRMNAGAMGAASSDCLEWLEILDSEGHIQRLPREALQFNYRNAPQLEGKLVLRAAFQGSPGTDPGQIAQQLLALSQRRKATQPRGASAGCAFKNPPGYSAGALIDQLGLKGERVGAAIVSPLHGNFIINSGGARSRDVRLLMQRLQARVYESVGIDLEPEVIGVGPDEGICLSEICAAR